MPDFSNYPTNQLQNSLNVIKNQNIKGATQDFGILLEKEIEKRSTNDSEKHFYSLIKRKVAQTSVGSSALRNQGAKGLIKISRHYFENEINLKEFKQQLYSDNFKEYLDNNTIRLRNLFPVNGQSWGAARKGLNLFLRDVIYNHYLREYLNINSDSIKHLQKLEIPLDKDVAKGLYQEKENKSLKRWKSIKSLDQNTSDEYQNIALSVAERKGILRVHLDLEYWRKAE